ncbi:MAG: Dolichyl-phosphate-mannose-protein mannosyltransferase-domain-containing protein [Benniella sp.]|nr:MAG: Dolichyl-phosphate-mannose-protein mannosyltransferase-domain-containing protein [Benniella sp.]
MSTSDSSNSATINKPMSYPNENTTTNSHMFPSSPNDSNSPLLTEAAMDPSLVADSGTSDIRDNALADLDQEDEDLKDQSLYHICQYRRMTDERVAATNHDTELERQHVKQSWQESQHLLGCGLSQHDWVALGVLTMVSLAREWKIDPPNELVMDEAHVGSAVNGYLTKSFTFDRHPPLTKLVLAGISSLTGYQGGFAFEEIGDPYPQNLPFLYMRATMALMGALCAPMAYVTLKAVDQSTAAAIAAAILVVFDNALTASSRLITLEAPLMFFTPLSLMSWTMFSKQSPRPFSAPWWIWLTMTSIGASGVLSVKANGLLTFLVIGFLSAKDMFNLAVTPSVNGALWAKHFFARNLLLVVLPVMVYLGAFQIHFSLQTHQPSSVTRSARAEYDLDLLSYPMRDTLVSSSTLHKERDYFNPDEDDSHQQQQQQQDMVWADIVYGSVIRLRSELRPSIFLHSFRQSWPRGSKQQQVTGYEYPDLNTHWIISKALTVHEEKKLAMTELPDKLRFFKHEMNGDQNDWWVIEAVDGDRMQKISRKLDIPVKALETAFRLKHSSLGCYLHATQEEVPKDLSGGPGRRELACLKSAKLSPSTIWRITLNDHDYLPMDTKIASYPKISFWQKFTQVHRLMWKKPRVFEQPNLSTKRTTHPLSWPLGHSNSIVIAWRKTHPTNQSKDRAETREIQ